MCGIAGVVGLGGAPVRADALRVMVEVIAHRGPDDAGYVVGRTDDPQAPFTALADRRFRAISPDLPVIDSDEGQRTLAEGGWNIFLGHRRLAILDLSPLGHQPMSRAAGRLWVTYNGEIYNFRELRAELEAEGHRFTSRSDTEVLLAAWEAWGIDCVQRFNGMFAFALWDGRSQRLHLARDRYGVKPLYLWRSRDALVFASEIKSILAYLDTRPGVDLLALNEYFSFQNVLSQRTLFDGIRLLPPATVLTVATASGSDSHHQYWDFDFAHPSPASEEELRERLYALIQEAVDRQCVSDVEIGSYLSGGMDSGTVTAITTRRLGRICTFTGGFDLSEAEAHELRFDERELAERLASILQTEHYECVLHAGDMEAVMDRLVWHLEDLRLGQSYPNYYIARLAGKFVKVVMSGAGGDELFGGYPWRYAAAAGADQSDYIQNYYRYWQRLVPNRDKLRFFAAAVRDCLARLDDDGAIPFRDHTLSVFRRVFPQRVAADTLAEQVNWSLYFECKTFLPGLLLVEDKLSMAHSLETRVPLLDNELVDFALQVPVHLKVSGLEQLERMDENLVPKRRGLRYSLHTGKSIMRAAMERILPPEITGARKQGFSAPDESWFRGRAEGYVRRELLAGDARLREYIDQEEVRRVLDEHAAGAANRRLLIWSILCFETWCRRFQ